MWISGDWKERKEQRRRMYLENQGLKLIRCTACSGSGYYDSHGSPACGSCSGTGRMREEPRDRDARIARQG